MDPGGANALLSSGSLPGTALHKLSRLVTGAATERRQGRSEPADRRQLNIRHPLQVLKEIKHHVTTLGYASQRRLATELSANITPPRGLPLGTLSLVIGLGLLAAGSYPGALLAAYGAGAILYRAVGRRRFRNHLLAAIDEAAKPDLQLIRSDRTRAEAITERFRTTGSLDFLETVDDPADLPIPSNERLLFSVANVLEAKAAKRGLQEGAEGRLLVTTARTLFLSDGQVSELELNRIVRTDVVDELCLTLTPSKRAPATAYLTLGHAHTLAAIIRSASAKP